MEWGFSLKNFPHVVSLQFNFFEHSREQSYILSAPYHFGEARSVFGCFWRQWSQESTGMCNEILLSSSHSSKNWSRARRWYITLFGGLLVLNAWARLAVGLLRVLSVICFLLALSRVRTCCKKNSNTHWRSDGCVGSAPSGNAQALIEAFNMSEEVAVLLVSLFVAGYCLGPILFAPLSEVSTIPSLSPSY